MFDNKSFSGVLFLRTLLLFIGFSLLSACATSVKVNGEIPAPLVEKIPLTVQLVYDDEFKRHVYEEEEKGRSLKSIAFGEAQVTLFDSIFSHLFTLVDPIELDLSEDSVASKNLHVISELNSVAGADLKVTPTLLDFQYSAPRETKLNLYEIWLKYRLKIEDSNNREIADWVVKGYGKTPTALLNSASKAFDSATNVALRDVGAQLAIGFSTQPEIKEFLSGHPNTKNSISDDEELIDEVELEKEIVSEPENLSQELSEQLESDEE